MSGNGKVVVTQIRVTDIGFGTDEGNRFATGTVAFDEEDGGPDIEITVSVYADDDQSIGLLREALAKTAMHHIRSVAEIPDAQLSALLDAGVAEPKPFEMPSDWLKKD